MTASRNLKSLLLLLGVLQGLALLALHILVIDNEVLTHYGWVMTCYTLAIVAPLALQLCIKTLKDHAPWTFTLVLSMILTGLAFYTASGFGVDKSDARFFMIASFISTLAIGLFILIPFAQSWISERRFHFPYKDLFFHSWNNGLNLVIAAIFTTIFWGLLYLCAFLFKAIGIDFFIDLFADKVFIYPITALTFAYSLSLGRQEKGPVATSRRVILMIFRSLMPILSLIAVMFVLTLPFQGLGTLWETKYATLILISLQVHMILFFNAVYQDGHSENTYHRYLRFFIKLSVLTLPVYMMISFYSLSLRIGQHGWSVLRVWGMITLILLGLYGLAYSVAVFVRKPPWMHWVSSLNVGVAFVIILIAFSMNSPLLNPYRIAAKSQVNRLLSEKIVVQDFDYNYLRFDLGNYGKEALQKLVTLQDHPKAETIRTYAQEALVRTSRYEYSRD
jgi:hypothetical protein